MGYADAYASNVAAIYRDLARSQAEAKLRSGQGWSNAIGQIGQIAAGLPGQLADERRAKQQEAIWQANLDDFNQKRQENQSLKDALNSSINEATGELDERRFKENLRLMGAAELAPRVLDPIRKSQLMKSELDNALLKGQIDQAQYQERVAQTLAPYAEALLKENGSAAALETALAAVQFTHGPQMASALRQQIEAAPEGVLPFVQSLVKPAEPEKPVVVGEGGMLVDPRTGKVIAENAKPEASQTLDQQLAAALKAGDRAKINEIIKLKAQEAAATRAPNQAPQPSYQRIETVDASGNPIIQYLTPEEVRKMGGVPTSPRSTAKASGPATVDAILGEITALSDKINTSGGGPMSNVTGLMRRGAAAGNMDNDVSEYQALVEGFIPMVARAVGHTGVLTQQDVDSVRALFPMPGDNSTLAKNKLERVKRIMQQMQSPDTAGRGAGAGKSAPDPLGIRKGGG